MRMMGWKSDIAIKTGRRKAPAQDFNVNHGMSAKFSEVMRGADDEDRKNFVMLMGAFQDSLVKEAKRIQEEDAAS